MKLNKALSEFHDLSDHLHLFNDESDNNRWNKAEATLRETYPQLADWQVRQLANNIEAVAKRKKAQDWVRERLSDEGRTPEQIASINNDIKDDDKFIRSRSYMPNPEDANYVYHSTPYGKDIKRSGLKSNSYYDSANDEHRPDQMIWVTDGDQGVRHSKEGGGYGADTFRIHKDHINNLGLSLKDTPTGETGIYGHKPFKIPNHMIERFDRRNGLWGKVAKPPEEASKSLSVIVNLSKAVERHPLEQRAIEHFGTTNDPKEAGFILRDGTMLDFSGRHADWWKDNKRTISHDHIKYAMPEDVTPHDFMNQAGAMRFHSMPGDKHYMGFIHPATSQQRMMATSNIRMGDPVSLDAGHTLDNYPSGMSGDFHKPIHSDEQGMSSRSRAMQMIDRANHAILHPETALKALSKSIPSPTGQELESPVPPIPGTAPIPEGTLRRFPHRSQPLKIIINLSKGMGKFSPYRIASRAKQAYNAFRGRPQVGPGKVIQAPKAPQPSQGGAEDYPQIHPSCVPAGQFIASPGTTGTTTRWYSGEIVYIETVSGNNLAVTPNHPILTPGGWIAAGLLDEGDNVIGCISSQTSSLIGNPNNNYIPTLIENVVKSFSEVAGVVTVAVPVSTEDFHGDGVGSDVCIINTDSFLRDGINPSVGQHLPEFDFCDRCGCSISLTSESVFDLGFDRHLEASHFGVSSKGALLPVLRSEHGIGQSKSLAHGSDSNTLGNQEISYGGSAVSSFERNILNSLSGKVFADNVVRICKSNFSGHVYNLSTVTGWYVIDNSTPHTDTNMQVRSGGVIVHNCQCMVTTDAQGNKQWVLGPKACSNCAKLAGNYNMEQRQAQMQSQQQQQIEQEAPSEQGETDGENAINMADYVG